MDDWNSERVTRGKIEERSEISLNIIKFVG